MNFDRDSTNTDEYFVTALQIFDCCGVESESTLHVDALMDKFAPFVKTNKAEFSYLKNLLDPEQCNPVINVSKLANALHKYSDSQKSKVDLDESFNRSGHAPQDSDSGISTDGMQLLEELQCELKEKEHLAHQLRNQLDFTDRQHEETIAALTAERDSLRRHLNVVREENAILSDVRRDYDDACERLVISSAALDEAKRELEAVKRRARLDKEQVAALEADKLCLQDLLSKSRDECHRINEMYAARQSALLEENETLKTEHADLSTKLQDQDEFMQQIIKEKVLLEMELKDMLNKSNQTHLRFDRSIDVSYTEDQMLTALDSLNADTRFCSDNRILDEESFMNALREDPQGRSTNMSLFDEIRMSFNVSRLNITEFNAVHCDKCSLDNSIVTTATQTDEGIEIKPYNNCGKAENSVKSVDAQTEYETQTCSNNVVDLATQTDDNVIKEVIIEKTDFGIQTDVIENRQSRKYKVTRKIDFENSIQDLESVNVSKIDTEIQTEVSMQNGLCVENNAQFLDAKDFTDTATQTIGQFIRKRPKLFKNAQKLLKLDKFRTAETQTDEVKAYLENNNAHCVKCLECDNLNKYTHKLERDVTYSNMVMNEMKAKIAEYEENLTCLENLIGKGKDKNETLRLLVDDLNSKIEVLEAACASQRDMINKLVSADTCCVQSQTEFDERTVSTQADVPCVECTRRAGTPPRSLRRFFWEPLKCLFQLFAVVCFLGAVSLLYGVSQRGAARCERAVTPWRWFDAQDVMDLLLRIEYTAEVPM